MIELRRHADDKEMIELYTMRDGKAVIWGVVHEDFLDDAMPDPSRLDGRKCFLTAVVESD